MSDLQELGVSVDDYLNLPESNLPSELINGAMITMPAPSPKHQKISRAIFRVLDSLVKTGELLYAPADVRLGDSIIQPDLFWIREDGDCHELDNLWQGAPDLVIEILSPSTAKRDRDEKFKLYQAHGVREYWLVEMDAEFLEVFVLKEGKYERQGYYQAEERLYSTTLKIELSAQQLFDGA